MLPPATILVIDDEKNVRRTLAMVLGGEGHAVLEAQSAEQGLAMLAEQDVDAVLLDVRLPGMNGVEALERIRATPGFEQLPVLMISGHASLAEAVDAIQKGATDFFEKPLDRDRIVVSMRNALKVWQLHRELDRLKASVSARYEMIGESAAMRQLFTQIEKVAPTAGRVIITGESGTGKELVARAIHRLSQRRAGPFIKVNCAAIPAELIESELFGYERGAFTGAAGRKKGMFELASDGTLFLDEIGDMSLSAQAKVLRALQSGEISRVGSEQTLSVDVRVLAATNKNIDREVAEGRFREDLFFRLSVIPLRSPALRERREDIVSLTMAFLAEFCAASGLPEKPIEPEVLDALTARPWPGNVRELRNVVERMVILSGRSITLDDLPTDPLALALAFEAAAESVPPNAPMSGLPPSLPPSDRPTLREHRERAERDYIRATLDDCDWNISRAATLLGVERTNLHKKIRAYAIRRE